MPTICRFLQYFYDGVFVLWENLSEPGRIDFLAASKGICPLVTSPREEFRRRWMFAPMSSSK